MIPKRQPEVDGTRRLEVEVTGSPDAVRASASPWLERHPYLANIPLTVLETLPPDGAGTSWALARDDTGAVVGVAMHSSGLPAYLPPMSPAAAVAIAQAWWEAGRRPEGVLGDTAATEAYARCWRDLSGLDLQPSLRETLYVLEALTAPDGVPGAPRTATPADLDLLVAWFDAFLVEVYPMRRDRVGEADIAARVEAGRILVWQEIVGQAPVAMCGFKPPAAGVGRIGPVYTPPAHRGRGFAGTVTAAATRAVLALGARPMLFTDAANPTSNGVYTRLGYRPRGEITRWTPA